MRCQNVQVGDALAHSIEVAASERWPAFGAKSWIVTDWFTKRRIRIPVLKGTPFGAEFIDESTPVYPFVPMFGTADFEPISIPELPYNVQLDYNEAADILVIALRSGRRRHETQQA